MENDPLQLKKYRRAPETSVTDINSNELGKMNVPCCKCDAWLFNAEVTAGSSARGTQCSTLCCGEGKVHLNPLLPPPEPLCHLLSDQDDPVAKEFRRHIRAYNCAFQFASSKANIDQRFTSGAHSFRISGVVHHLIGPLMPAAGEPPRFAQLYIIDDDNEELEARLTVMSELPTNSRQFTDHAAPV